MIDQVLRSSAHFRKLPDEALERLAAGFAQKTFGIDETIYSRDEPVDALYVVARGTVITLSKRSTPETRPLDRLRCGDILGISDFFDSPVRTEDARTTEESVLLRCSKDHLLDFVASQPQVALTLRLAAARDLTARANAALPEALRGVARHRVNTEVRLEPAEGRPVPATLVDLSPQGMAIRGAPDRWQREDVVRYLLSWCEKRLGIAGRVAWRDGELVGIDLRDAPDELQAELQETLEKMLQVAA